MKFLINATPFLSLFNGVNVNGVKVLSEHCSTIKADFARRQRSEWNATAAFTSSDGSVNVPVLTVAGDEFTIEVPSATQVASDDPNTVHFVTHLYAEDQDGTVVFMQTLNPLTDGPPKISSLMPAGITELTPYAFNNLDGLWVGDAVSTGGTEDPDRIITCGEGESLQFPGGAFASVIADLERQQKLTFGSDVPFTESDGVKHTPYITFPLTYSGTGSVEVGAGTEIHPMLGSADGISEPHWITEIWIVDDQGYTTSMKSMDPTGVDYAVYEFYPNSNSKQVTAYLWCNIHGMYVGPTVDVPEKNDWSLDDDTIGQDEQPTDSAYGITASIGSFLIGALPMFFM